MCASMVEVVLKIVCKLKVCSRLQVFIEGSTNDYFFEILRNCSENSSNAKNIMEGFILHILRVFRSETWLTVYRALYIIPKHFGGAKGCLGAYRYSGPQKDRKLLKR